jgi:hypothetical protein
VIPQIATDIKNKTETAVPLFKTALIKLFLTPPVLQLASKHFTNEHMWQISLCVGISGISPLLPRHTDAHLLHQKNFQTQLEEQTSLHHNSQACS